VRVTVRRSAGPPVRRPAEVPPIPYQQLAGLAVHHEFMRRLEELRQRLRDDRFSAPGMRREAQIVRERAVDAAVGRQRREPGQLTDAARAPVEPMACPGAPRQPGAPGVPAAILEQDDRARQVGDRRDQLRERRGGGQPCFP